MLKLGTATKIITPADVDKIWLSGMPRQGPLHGVLDDTEVNVNVLFDGQRYVICCVLDLVFVYTEMHDEILAAIQDVCPNAILILSCIHDHSGAAIARDKDDPEHVAAAGRHAELVITQSIAAIKEAAAHMFEVECASTRTHLEEKLGSCRRAKLDNGACVTAWGAGPILPPGRKWSGYSGPDADWIDILAFKKPGAKEPCALMTSYGSHIHFYEVPMVTGEGGGYARAHLRKALPDTAIAYNTSYAGDVALLFNHPMPDANEEELINWQRSSSEAYADAFTQCVKRSLSTLDFQQVETLAIQDHRWEDERETGGRKASYMLQSVKLGSSVLCSMPGEVFLDWDAHLRNESPAAHIFVIGYNTSWLGYVATPIGFEEGSYECMRGPADKIGYGDNPSRVKSGTETGGELIGKMREQIAALFSD